MAMSCNARGWTVVLAGTGTNLLLGILYTWSLFKDAINASLHQGGEGAFQWDPASLNDPYAVCCLMWGFAMLLGGKCQERVGPRVTAILGGVSLGAGFLLISQTTSYAFWVLGFGVLFGTGIGLSYSAVLTASLKWFPPQKTGLVAGLVVGGFGLASAYTAPLASWLLKSGGLAWTTMVIGIVFSVLVVLLALPVRNPTSEESDAVAQKGRTLGGNAALLANKPSLSPLQVMRTRDFYVMWILYFIGAGTGLMVISSLASMAKASLSDRAFVAISILAVGNAAGRVVAGFASDHWGRTLTLALVLGAQAILMFLAIPVVTTPHAAAVLIILLATLIGFNFGANLSLFPAITKDLWGPQHFGTNYGLMYIGWGLGGLVLCRISEMMKAATGSFTLSFFTAGLLLSLAVVLLAVHSLLRKRGESKAVTPGRF